MKELKFFSSLQHAHKSWASTLSRFYQFIIFLKTYKPENFRIWIYDVGFSFVELGNVLPV